MRTIGFRSNILFAIAAAFGVVASLSRPWYALAPRPAGTQDIGQLPSQMEDFFNGIGRAFSEPRGTTGWVALQTADHVVAGLAVATVVLLVLALVPAIQRHVQDLARWTALATFAVVLFKLFDEPGANRLHEPRYGVLVALGSAGVLVASAMTVANAPIRRRAEIQTYTPLPAPDYKPDSSYGPPQF
jgi:hypothetical protein